jgi:alpha-beta hydrolase superfamily lysophospholipase
MCAGLAACGAASNTGGGAVDATPSTSPARAGEVPATDRDVTFAVDGTTTYGTVHIPAHRDGQRLAAALLLAGSGPTDRNGDQPGGNVTPQTLKLIADVLGTQGIMSLRFDKYFTGQTGGGAYAQDPGSIDLTAYIRQAEAAYHQLRAQPEADQQHLLIVGHSEGGMYALLVAASVTPHPAGLALMEPQDERLLSLIQLQTDEQLNAAVTAGTLSAAAAQHNAALVERAIAAFRAGQPVDTSGMSADVAQLIAPILLTPENARYVRSDDAVRPATVAARIAAGTRVLITDGTLDTNVPVSTINLLADALASAGTTGPGLRVLTGVNHFLHVPGTPENDPVLAPAVVAALDDWARPYASGS